ncbi:MAG: hypothetical protein PHH58_10650 [Rhodoferax sp.]|nr:hypothetical protein [Rhodoferax sp.]
MKPSLTPDTRRRLLLLAGLLLTLWATWQVSQDAPAPSVVAERSTRRAPARPSAPASALPLVWPERAERTDAQRPITDLFGPAPPLAVAASAALPAGPAKPEFKLKYIGHLIDGANSHVFLADAQGQVVTAKVGQAVGGDWQLTAMTDQQLVFRHTPTGQENTLQIGTSP